MPAPDREMPKQSFTTSVAVPRGLWGYYTDIEVDAMLAALPAGGGAVDLSAYATTAYVDGQVAKVYTKAEVDAAIAAAATGDVDLSAYATAEQLDGVKTEIMTAATAAFQERYTKPEVDSLFVKQADMVAPPSLDGYATEQYVDDSIARIPATDLSAYAKLEDSAQTIKASQVEVVSGVLFDGGKVGLAHTDTGEGFGERLVLAKQGGVEYVVMKSDLGPLDGLIPRVEALEAAAPPDAADLSAYAKTTDADQVITTKSVIAQGYGFSTVEVLKVHDTGEGYGPRLSWITAEGGGVNIDMVCLKSDIDPLAAMLPRVEALESKAVMGATDEPAVNVQQSVLYWGNPSTAPTALGTDATKKKWITVGSTEPIPFVAGRTYRIDCRLALGSLNVDVLQQWLGVRATADAGAPLPVDGVPLVNLHGLGTSTITGERGEIKASGLVDGPTAIYRFACVDDWTSAGEVLTYTMEFRASETKTARVEFGFAWGGTWKTNIANVQPTVAVVRGLEPVPEGGPAADLTEYAKTAWVVAWLDANAPNKNAVYTKNEADTTFAPAGEAYTRQQADALFATKGETAAQALTGVDVNDPALAEFKQGILDSVAKMLAGGDKQPPSDIPWTNCLNTNGTPQTVVAARMIGGVIEFKGVMSISSGSSSRDLFKLPDTFPPFELTASYPVAARLAGTNAVYAYATVTANARVVGVTPAGTINEVTVSGLRIKAAY